MPIIGRQCTRDLRTICLRMSEAALTVNQSGPGLTLVYGWGSEERRAQGASPGVQGIDFCNSSGKLIALDFCPWCGAKIASSAAAVRTQSNAPAAPSAARPEPAPSADRPRPSEPKRAAPAPEAAPPSAPSSPAPRPAPQFAPGPHAPSLKALREKLGLSQAELGEKLGLARSSIANYENGRAPLSERLRKWMAKYEKKLGDRA